MIKQISLFLLLSLSLFSTTLNDTKIFENEEMIDIMLTFDDPYQGKITQKREDDAVILTLEACQIQKNITKEPHSDLLESMHIIPYKENLFIKLDAKTPFNVEASKTLDLYGLRLRISPLQEKEKITPIEDTSDMKLETKKEDGIEGAYLKMLLVLFFLIALLYILKRWLAQRGNDFPSNWLFSTIEKAKETKIEILHQRPLDRTNRLALVSYNQKEYLLLLGSNNLLLDSFSSLESPVKKDFEAHLEENQEDLKEFIKKKKMQAYKEKISFE